LKIVPVILLLLLSCAAYAQSARKTVDDMNREAMDERVLEKITTTDYNSLKKEYDYSRKMLRVLNLDLPANKVLSTIVDGTGTVYSIADLLFKLAINNEVKAIVNPEHVDVLEKEQLERYRSVVDTINVFSVNRLIMKEQWLYDKEIKKFIVKITYIALAYESEKGNLKPLFWMFYPELRNCSNEYMIKDKVRNRENKRKKVSLNEYFEGRYFESHIVRVPN